MGDPNNNNPCATLDRTSQTAGLCPAAFYPHLATVDAHARMDPQILANCSVHATHSVRFGDTVYVIQVREQFFRRQQLCADGLQCPVLTPRASRDLLAPRPLPDERCEWCLWHPPTSTAKVCRRRVLQRGALHLLRPRATDRWAWLPGRSSRKRLHRRVTQLWFPGLPPLTPAPRGRRIRNRPWWRARIGRILLPLPLLDPIVEQLCGPQLSESHLQRLCPSLLHSASGGL